jgi:DNA-binding CsgD family transcriptional regulator
MKDGFSPRQREIVALIAAGMADKEIAKQLKVSTATVRTHLQRMYRSNGTHNRAMAVALWLGQRHAVDVSL